MLMLLLFLQKVRNQKKTEEHLRYRKRENILK